MTKTELEKKVAEMQEQFDKMQNQLDELKQVKVEELKKRWKPKIDKTYWYIGYGGHTDWAYWYDDNVDNWRYLIGNVFETEEKANEHKKKLEIQSQFKNFVEDRSEELDFKNNKQTKYHLQYDYYNNVITYDWNQSYKVQGTIYASSGQILRDAIAEIGEENIKKYVLEVEDDSRRRNYSKK